jgi:hypothetical protein
MKINRNALRLAEKVLYSSFIYILIFNFIANEIDDKNIATESTVLLKRPEMMRQYNAPIKML